MKKKLKLKFIEDCLKEKDLGSIIGGVSGCGALQACVAYVGSKCDNLVRCTAHAKNA
jgi:hypothetical protein